MDSHVTGMVKSVLESDKFEKVLKNDEIMYFDKEMKVYVPKQNIHALVREIITDPKSGTVLKTPEHYDLCQVRVMRLLKKDFPILKNISYKTVFMKYLSDNFLLSNINKEIDFSSLFVDLVGSTLMSMKLNSERMTMLVNIFTQEMSSIVSANNGHVLKYAGDAVIAYFPKIENTNDTNALSCAEDMLDMLDKGINRALVKNGFDPLSIRIGIESGKNKIMVVGNTVDIIGKTMNIAAKVTSIAKPNGIAIGGKYHSHLNSEIQSKFSPVTPDSTWKYKEDDGSPYKVFENVPIA